VTYDEVVEHIVRAIEAFGILVLVVGAVIALGQWLIQARDPELRSDAYLSLRRKLARVILLGLEILLLADIILTIVVEPTLDSVAILAVIVAIRIVLSFSLEVEIDGAWPWNRWRTAPAEAGDDRR
jgi:uncharacterized membrane protein